MQRVLQKSDLVGASAPAKRSAVLVLQATLLPSLEDQPNAFNGDPLQ